MGGEWQKGKGERKELGLRELNQELEFGGWSLGLELGLGVGVGLSLSLLVDDV